MPSSKSEKQPSFSIDEFIGEIENAEAEQLGKRLPQERLRNKRALDNAARRAAEKAGTTGELVPQPLQRDETALVDKGKGKRSAATGMSLKARSRRPIQSSVRISAAWASPIRPASATCRRATPFPLRRRRPKFRAARPERRSPCPARTSRARRPSASRPR